MDQIMHLHLHRAARADRLVDVLAGVLADPPDDPMATELVAVHSRGIERWLAQELSARLGAGTGRRDGVCANVEFPFPGRVVDRALAAAGGVDADTDPWRPERLVWALLELVDAHLDEPWLEPLRAHLGGGDGHDDPTRSGRRFSAVRHIADLFDRYGIHRPQMVRRWAAGHGLDESGAGLDADVAWQARLWLEVRRALGVPSPAERMTEAVAALHAGLEVPGLPSRLSLFGLTALPGSYVEVLSALAANRDVHLFLLHPSPSLWRRVEQVLDGQVLDGQAPDRAPQGWAPRDRMSRDDDPTRELPRHPLLASWGRDAREMQLVVHRTGMSLQVGPSSPAANALTSRQGSSGRRQPLTEGPPAVPGGGTIEPTTLLGRIQADVHADRAPTGPPLPGDADRRPVLDVADRSLQVHACHGRTRQVEVLRDAILHLLADDSSLEPRDIVVMCPDIETFAPLVHAVFGAHAVVDEGVAGGADAGAGDGEGRPSLPDLRVRLADRAIRQTNPVLRVVAELIDLADGRLAASHVLDLASREPVRRRFRFDDDDLERLDAWVVQAGVRWGLDGDHRAAFGLEGVEENTWRAGLDRLLLGVAMADEDDRMLGGAVPLDDVEGSDVGLAGRVAELLDRLGEAVTCLRRTHDVAGWCQVIAHVADLLTATGERDRWQTVQLQRILDDIVGEATVDGAASGVGLTLAEIRHLLDDRLRGRPSRANHRTGDLTVCTLVPMRSVPHRVVCLLGMDDDAFPRRTAGDGDDLIERAPKVGDRDPRTEDRQLLLDALLAAKSHLVVTYTGRDERTNEPRPPAVPVGELFDVADRTVRAAGSGAARDQVVVEHPLQPFDARNFSQGRLVSGRPWGFDRAALAGARAKARREPADASFLAKPLGPVEDGDTVMLDELVRFLEHPVKAFLRRRLGVSLGAAGDGPSDAMPVELGGLEAYAVGDRLLRARLAGVDLGRWTAAERARGVLPPGALADGQLAELFTTVDQLLSAAGDHADLDAERTTLPVDVTLRDGRSLTGAVADIAGDVLLTLHYSRVKPKHRLAAWARLLAATAAHPDRRLRAVTAGRCRRSGSTKSVSVARVAAPDGTADERRRWALHHLDCLVDLHDSGLREPLPVSSATSAAYAAAVREGKDGRAAARGEWTTTWRYPKEDRDPAHVLVLGQDAPLETLLAESPGDGEEGDGWAATEQTRFGRCARRLWDGLLDIEEVEDC